MEDELGDGAKVPAELEAELKAKTSVPLWPTVGKAIGLSRNATYEAAKRGDFPTNKFGKRITAPTAPLRRLLGIDPSREKSSPA